MTPSFRGRPHSQYTAQEATRLVRAGPDLALQREADARIRTGDPFITRSLLPLRVLAAEREYRLLALNPQ